MTYQINIENTGLATDEQAAEVARILAAKGYDVAFTRTLGLINGGDEPSPFEGGAGLTDWEDALIAADKAFPA